MNVLRIVVIGPESTGKSTLSADLAAALQTGWVAEHARSYIEALERPYTENDLLRIAAGQLAAEDRAAAMANQVLVCDTDLYVIKVWSEHKYGHCHPWVLQQIAERHYNLYLLTDIDIAWADDPQREHPEPVMRHYFYAVYQDIVMNSGTAWAAISGSRERRLQTALEAVRKLL